MYTKCILYMSVPSCFFGCDYCTQSSSPSFEKMFPSEMVKNDICLGGALRVSSKQNALF